ncbi:MAG TPA: hypothetical protein VNI01_07900 [Elusimicrobiota bacterium]|jgi:hypothetical protein|nr:hypothetical protein [Elusimicrobiota bacterium]
MKKATIILAAVALAACAGVDHKVDSKGQVKGVIDQQPVASSYVEAIGIGASDPTLPTETQRKALARDAAIVKAQYEMLSMVKGVEIEGGVTVERALEKDSTLEARLKEVIRGAEILKTEFTSDHGAVVTMRLPKKRLEQMMAVKFK